MPSQSRKQFFTNALADSLPSFKTLAIGSFLLGMIGYAQAASGSKENKDKAWYEKALGSNFDLCVQVATHYASCIAQQLYNPNSPRNAAMQDLFKQASYGLMNEIPQEAYQALPPELSGYECPANEGDIKSFLFKLYDVPAAAQAVCGQLMDQSNNVDVSAHSSFQLRGNGN